MIATFKKENKFFADFYNMHFRQHDQNNIEFSDSGKHRIFVSYEESEDLKLLTIMTPLLFDTNFTSETIIKTALRDHAICRNFRHYEKIDFIGDKVVFIMNYGLREKITGRDKLIYVSSLQQVRMAGICLPEMVVNSIKQVMQTMLN